MTAGSELTATPREIIGKANRRLSAANAIPAVLYGPGREPMPLSINRHDFELFMQHHAEGATLVDLRIEGGSTINAMIREVQHSAVKGTILHVDLLEVSMDKPVHAVVPMRLVNDAAGVKAGGLLTASLHEINISAKPGELPDAIEFDVTDLEVGDSVHVSDLTAPAGVTILDDPETIVASIVAPKAAESEEPELEEGPAPAVIGEEAEE